MPPTAATVRVPPRVPPPGLLPRATVTLEVSVVSRLPNWSSTRTVTAGRMATPAAALLGCVPNGRWAAAAGGAGKVAEGAPPRPPSPAGRVEPAAVLSMDRLLKVAIPPLAATVRVPARVPPPGL